MLQGREGWLVLQKGREVEGLVCVMGSRCVAAAAAAAAVGGRLICVGVWFARLGFDGSGLCLGARLRGVSSGHCCCCGVGCSRDSCVVAVCLWRCIAAVMLSPLRVGLLVAHCMCLCPVGILGCGAAVGLLLWWLMW